MLHKTVFLCVFMTRFVVSLDWMERYNVDPRRSALVWTTAHNISQVLCPNLNQPSSTVAPERSVRADYNIPVDLAPDTQLSEGEMRVLRRKEDRVKAILEGVIGDTRIVNQDKARLLGEVTGEMVSKCLREAGVASIANTTGDGLESNLIEGIVLPLGGAIAKIFLERPPPAESVADRHLDFDLGANTFLRGNSMQNNVLVRSVVTEVHWEALSRYGIKLLGNTMSREEYLDAIGFATGLTISVIHQINGTVLRQDVVTTARKYVGNFLKAYLMMSNQYYSFMDNTVSWLADDIALYTADDILRICNSTYTGQVRTEWNRYAQEANKGLRTLRLVSIGLLLVYRNAPTEIRFQPAETILGLLPPSWLSLRYLYPVV